MKNYICDGERMQVVLGAAAASGDVLVIGSKVCVAMTGGSTGDTVVVMNEGVFELAKAVGAITQGQKLYFDATAKNITITAIDNTFAGYAYLPAASGDAIIQVLLVDNPSDPGYVQVANQVASTATDVAGLKTDLNALLVKLKSAGVMTPDA